MRKFKNYQSEKFYRFHIIRILIYIIFLLISVRLALISIAPMISKKTSLQDIINISRYVESWHRLETKEYERGIILDRNKEKLAFSVKTFSLAVNPYLVPEQNKSELAHLISTHFPQNYEDVYKRLNTNRRFVWLQRKIENDKYLEILPYIRKYFRKGIMLNEEYKRIYPDSEYFSNIIGFTGIDNIGLEGVEAYFDKILREPGLPIIKTADGVYKEEDKIVEDFNTSNVILTIDKNIQKIAYDQLKEAVEHFQAQRAMCIIVNPKTGEIIALVRYPGFDNSNFNITDDRRNWLVTDFYEPGSTIKIVSVAALLQEHNIDLNKTVNDPSYVRIYNHTYHNSDRVALGNINILDAFIKSSNVGIIQFMKPLERNIFYSYLRNFGFGIVSGIELPGESSGLLRPARRWSGLSKYSISIGQEIAVTPLQLVMALSTVANNGILLKPTIIKEIRNAKGEITVQKSSIAIRQVLSSEVNDRLKQFMIDAVEDGTGRQARISGIKVAGKTGTAQKAIKGEYSRDKYIASFYGFFPAENPEYSMLVIVDEPSPEKSIYGGAVAAPVFRRIGREILEYHKKIESNTIIYKEYPVARSRINRQNQNNYDNSSVLADLRGLSLRKALSYLSYHNIKSEITGNGYVKNQFPEPGTKITDISQVVLNLGD